MLKTKLLVLAIFVLPLTANAADWKTVPIADVHRHVYDNQFEHTSASLVLEQLKRNNVLWAGGVGDGGRIQLRNALGNRYISAYGQAEWTRVFIQEGGNHALENVDNFRSFIEDFEGGDFDGIGEIHTNSLGRAHRNTPIDGPMMLKMYQHLNKKGGWIQIHHSASRAPYQDLVAVAIKFPRVRFIMSHCMFDRRGKVMQKVFDQTKNVYCEISSMGPLLGEPANNRRARMYGPNGIDPGWLAVIKAHPTRVMVGSDTCCGLNNRYDDIIGAVRKYFLANLEEPYRSNLAYKNAVMVFHLPK
jgi:hypothetical protein